jgi:hypothetical protein
MVKLLTIMHHLTLCITCIAFILVSYTCIFLIDHVEPEREEPSELAPVEDANLEQDQGNLWCI